MDLLYRVGGLSGTEIGEMMVVDYSTMSLGRKRLREKLKGDKHLSQITQRVEADLSIIKICPLLPLCENKKCLTIKVGTLWESLEGKSKIGGNI